MAISTNHPAYAMAVRRTPGLVYGIAFFLCMAVMAVAFMYFLQHGFFLIKVPAINFQLPNLHLGTGA